MATILCVDDEPSVAVLVERALREVGHEPILANSVAEAMKVVDWRAPDLIISDYSMPNETGLDLLRRLREGSYEIPVIIVTGYASVENAVTSMRHGAVDYLTKPVRAESLRIAVNQALEVVRLRRENEAFRLELRSLRGQRAIVGESDALRLVLDVIATVAPTRATVLLQGESGTGKELFARALHDASPRADKPFIILNCAAMPSNLVESALFGHEKGAFTGATSRFRGAFERADGGSLLLDEISEMQLDLQAKLLRVVQEQEFERVGGDETINVDVRIIATTNRNLEEETNTGRFRADLFYRLSVVPIHTPSLRERRADIPRLANYFLKRAAEQEGKEPTSIEQRALDILQAYDWPGNVRELAHAVERAWILSGGRRLRAEDFRLPVSPAWSNPASQSADLPLNLEELERVAIERALEETGGHRSRAAKLLGISERTLRNKLKPRSA
jgi:DNA-binding NtrC family response regulator